MEGETKSVAAESTSKNEKEQGRGRGNPRGNNRGKSNNKEKAFNKPEFTNKEKLTGRSDGLEGYVYIAVSTKGGVQFARTTEEIKILHSRVAHMYRDTYQDGTAAYETYRPNRR
jgi:hypothetical protein